MYKIQIITKIKVTLRYISLILFFPLIVFIAVFIKLIRPLILIRWSRLDNARIGHYLADIDIYLLEKKFKKSVPKELYIDFFYKPELKICNKQLDKMWRSKLMITPWCFGFVFEHLRHKKILFKDENYFDTTSKDRHNLIFSTSPILSLSSKEKKLGFEFLNKIGLPEKPKFVCLQVRDGAYLPDKRYDFHEYRNCDVENFKSACTFLADQNIYVFRMGAKVNKKISFANSKIIDYATNNMRTDFLDIFLGSECLFWISTGSGIDNLSKTFRKPILYVNQVPFGHISTYQKTSLIYFKHFVDRISNNQLNLDMLKQKELCFATKSETFANKDVIVRENSQQEIESATKEMYQRVKNNFWEPWDETKNKQKEFWNKFPYEKELHGQIVANIAKEFLIKHKNFYN